MKTDISEKGLETLVVEGLCANGWTKGDPRDFNAEWCIDLVQFRAFIEVTQPELTAALDLENDSPTRKKFLDRLDKEISSKGIVDVLRNGVKHGAHTIQLFYGKPSPGNATAAALNAANRFVATRQLHFSPTDTALSLDVCLMINGLPVITMELKNNYTKQDVKDAIEQYKNDRDPRERIFAFKRTLAHLAVDDQQAEFCTKLAKSDSWFLPFNQGYNDGAGNPPNLSGLKIAYLYEKILTRESLTDIIENYAQLIEQEVVDRITKKSRKREAQIWPRFHQLDVVRRLLADASAYGPGKKYLIQHSAGSGKSNSIAWLVHQLVGLEHSVEGAMVPVFDSIIVVTNRTILDQQIKETIKSFAQVGATVGHAEKSKDLNEMIIAGKKIIITTVQKFPFIVNAIGDAHRDRHFAIVIDEAHDSQSGKTAAALSKALQAKSAPEVAETIDTFENEVQELAIDMDDDDDGDDAGVQDLINQAIAGRKMATNASYFAFTATPKNKTLEMFGTPYSENGVVKHRPFHSYTMKQAIEEGFIVDVLSSYTTVNSYYKLVKTIESDPEFDTKRAKKKLRAYVEGHKHVVEVKAGIIVDHFLDQVIAPRKLGGEARAMVVCGSIRRAIEYFHAISEELNARGGQYKAIVAFSGEHDYAGVKVTETSLNGFPAKEIASRIQDEPYRILVCADKFQTGYDEPLLHTMYVDKVLSGVKAVQTLSRLNRAHPKKREVFVLDFQNEADDIKEAFEPFFRTTILADETDPNKLHDLKDILDGAGVYSQENVDLVVERFLKGVSRIEIDPTIDSCVANYNQLEEDPQVEFKSAAKTFVRSYDFLGAIISYGLPEWERLSIFLNLLVNKLPAPKEADLAQGILDNIDMDSYRAEKQATAKIMLADEDGELQPVPVAAASGKAEAEMDLLSNILREFDDLFGNIQWSDKDRLLRAIAEEIPARVNADERYQNAQKNSDKENARIEHDRALTDAIHERMGDESELFAKFFQDPYFAQWLRDKIFDATYRQSLTSGSDPSKEN